MEVAVSDIETIENLSSKGYTIKAIAIALDLRPSLFSIYCNDESHPIGRAYLRGGLEIERKKKQALLDKVFEGSETAIQLHDKKAKDQAFKDIKADIFSSIEDE